MRTNLLIIIVLQQRLLQDRNQNCKPLKEASGLGIAPTAAVSPASFSGDLANGGNMDLKEKKMLGFKKKLTTKGA